MGVCTIVMLYDLEDIALVFADVAVEPVLFVPVPLRGIQSIHLELFIVPC
jgi:hypothetical protein